MATVHTIDQLESLSVEARWTLTVEYLKASADANGIQASELWERLFGHN